MHGNKLWLSMFRNFTNELRVHGVTRIHARIWLAEIYGERISNIIKVLHQSVILRIPVLFRTNHEQSIIVLSIILVDMN